MFKQENAPLVFVKLTKQYNESRHNIYNKVLTSKELLTLLDNPNENPNNSYNILHQIIQNTKTNSMASKLVKYNKYNIKILNG